MKNNNSKHSPASDWRLTLFLLGAMVIGISGLTLIPVAYNLLSGAGGNPAFIFSAFVSFFFGSVLFLGNRVENFEGHELTIRQAFLLTALCWFAAGVFCALPFAFSSPGVSFVDAFFEATSGLTTTGATVFSGLDSMPRDILLWRALTQWVGGVGIIVIAIAILPMLRIGGMQLFRSESSDKSEKIFSKLHKLSYAISSVYLFLTWACALLYWAFGMSGFDALSHALTTVSTGGYSTSDLSMGKFQSPAIWWTCIAFMLLGGMPFVLYVKALKENAIVIFKDSQVIAFLAIVAGVSAVLAAWLVYSGTHGFFDAVTQVVFHVVSIITTTGYALQDYTLWGTAAIGIFFVLTFVGGCTGSTSGGIKIFRLQIMYQVQKRQMEKMLHPNSVKNVKYAGRPVSDEIIKSVMGFVFLYVLSFAVIAMILQFQGLDFTTSLSASITAISNVGPGLGHIVGPAGNFSSLPDSSKWVLSFGMLLGRLEVFTLLVLVTPWFWRK